jgi:hypothetical protein
MKKKILLVILFLCCIFMKVYIKDSLTADLGNSAVELWKANPFMYSLGYCPGYSYITCYSCYCGQVNYQTCSYCTCCCHPSHTYTSSYGDYNACGNDPSQHVRAGDVHRARRSRS